MEIQAAECGLFLRGRHQNILMAACVLSGMIQHENSSARIDPILSEVYLPTQAGCMQVLSDMLHLRAGGGGAVRLFQRGSARPVADPALQPPE